ncbi:MerR family transcriptional regulator [Streptomyces indicus]|uniref:B12 binding domain-containing protein n=1 Tax=Streptomyces indicus TaxID=417292 RepID=A0A1G8TT74_9ACTN|nr:MerR family transcriptional regulator [Streptomyces indicus]SDJ44718.1 B12 binding domain-containing protein [Streptomyces indicus]
MSTDSDPAHTAPAPRAPVSADVGLTTGDVARRLGIQPTTLRSWDRRYGIGPSGHDAGRHRRWAPQDIAVLEEMCRLTALGVPPAEAARSARATAGGEPRPGTEGERQSDTDEEATSSAPADPRRTPAGALPLGRNARAESRGIASAATRLDAASVQQQLDGVVSTYGPVEAWQEVIMPCLQAVGRRWEDAGDRHVEIEHLLSWHVSSALRGAPLSPERSGSAAAVLACVPGEQHTLALEALAAALGEQGVAVRMFGGALPAPALEDAVRRIGPAAVVLWSQVRSTANLPLAAHVRTIDWGLRGARRHPQVLLGGPGWPATVRDFPRLHTLQGAVDAVRAACGS